MTPELAATERLREAAAALAPCLIAVDEAHCVSEWGHDLRPEYASCTSCARAAARRRKEEEADALRGVPLMAVTATATPRTRDDICANLALRAPRASPSASTGPTSSHRAPRQDGRRPRGRGARRRPRRRHRLRAHHARGGGGRRARSERALGRPVGAYHAKMERRARGGPPRLVRDALTTVVATLAFGMGIDKPDVRLVAHYGAPKTLESYYQQAGRAGRDGEPARCVLLHAAADWPRMQALLTRGVDEGTAAARAPACARCAPSATSARATPAGARPSRRLGDAAGAIRCGACDVCRAPRARPRRASTRRTPRAPSSRSCATSRVVRPRHRARGVPRRRLGQARAPRGAPLLGAGAAHAAPLLQAVADACRARGLLEDVVREPRAGVVYAAPALTEAGAAWLADADAALDVAAADAARARRRAAASAAARAAAARRARRPRRATTRSRAPTPRSLERLRVARRAAADGLPPYMVCSDATLREIARRKPRTRAALLDVPGIGRHKVETLATPFAAVAAPP